jgi:hypothetical protein
MASAAKRIVEKENKAFVAAVCGPARVMGTPQIAH